MGSTTTLDVEVRRGDTEDDRVTVEAVSETGYEFVDAYTPKGGQEFEVVDSGWIRIPLDAEEDFLAAAKERGLTIERSE